MSASKIHVDTPVLLEVVYVIKMTSSALNIEGRAKEEEIMRNLI